MNDYITTTKQSTTKPCAYFLGYTVDEDTTTCKRFPHYWPLARHDDVIKWKRFLRYWPSVRGIHRWPGNSPHKSQWRGALMFPLICAWIVGPGDLRRHRAHYDVSIMGESNGRRRIPQQRDRMWKFGDVFIYIYIYIYIYKPWVLYKQMNKGK